jgi:hypothetical protein
MRLPETKTRNSMRGSKSFLNRIKDSRVDSNVKKLLWIIWQLQINSFLKIPKICMEKCIRINKKSNNLNYRLSKRPNNIRLKWIIYNPSTLKKKSNYNPSTLLKKSNSKKQFKTWNFQLALPIQKLNIKRNSWAIKTSEFYNFKFNSRIKGEKKRRSSSYWRKNVNCSKRRKRRAKEIYSGKGQSDH